MKFIQGTRGVQALNWHGARIQRQYIHDCKVQLNRLVQRQPRRQQLPLVSATKIKSLSRKKHSCYARKRELIERLFLHYGSDIRRENIKICEAAAATGIKKWAAYKQVQLYEERGCNFREPHEEHPNKIHAFKKRKLVGHTEDYLRDTLQEWQNLSLEKRCQIINEELSINVSHTTLRKTYIRLGISHLRPPYFLASKFTEGQIRQQQKCFIVKLVDLIIKKAEVILIDEMSTHLWERRLKFWMQRDQPIYQRLAPQRGVSIAILGAISTNQSEMIYQVARKSNGASYKQLLQKIVAKTQNPQNTILVCDQASYHKNAECLSYLKRKGIGVLFMPPKSSALNGIEYCWALFKRSFNQRISRKSAEELKLLCKKGNDQIIQSEVAQQLRRFVGEYDFSVFAKHSMKEMKKLMERISPN